MFVAPTLVCFSPFSLVELQAKLLSSETEVKSKLLELDSLKGKLQDASSENTRLLERIKSIEALLEAGQMREAEKDRNLKVLCIFTLGERRRGGLHCFAADVEGICLCPASSRWFSS